MFAARELTAISALLISVWLTGPSAGAAEDIEKKTAPSTKLLVTGSSTMAPMIMEIAQRFQSLHPGTQIGVQTGGSGRGLGDVQQGKADIGMVSRALTDKESGIYSFAIARDGISLIVHKSNPIRNLTRQQVADIYTGRIANWSKVGGRDALILVVTPREGYSSAEMFTHFFDIKYLDIKARQVLGDNAERINAVVAAPDAISYVSVGEAERVAEAGIPIKSLPIDGVAATKKNIRSGDFPIPRPLLLITKDAPTGLAKAFISFALSSHVTDIVNKYDFVPYLD